MQGLSESDSRVGQDAVGNDEPARAILAGCFPGRDIMQIDAIDIVQGGGGIHCITQQEPLA